ncbi:hypothetical protein BJX64DRAFT_283898 [Aspergillus heterothallicus]
MSEIRYVTQTDSDYDSDTDSDSDLELEHHHHVSSSERETTPDEDGDSDDSSGDETEVAGNCEMKNGMDELTDTVVASVAALQLGLQLSVVDASEQHKHASADQDPASPATFLTCPEPATPTTLIASAASVSTVGPTLCVDKDEKEEADQEEQHRQEVSKECVAKPEEEQTTVKTATDEKEKADNEDSVLLLPVPPPASPISPIFPIPRPVSVSPPMPLIIKPLPLAICAPPPAPEIDSLQTKAVSVSPSSSSTSKSKARKKKNKKKKKKKKKTETNRAAQTDSESKTEPDPKLADPAEAILLAYLQEIDGHSSADIHDDAREDLIKSLPLPLRLPFALPKDTKVKEEILPATAFERRFVNKDIGYGLVALQHIPAGTIIFADPLLTVWSEEQEACRQMNDAHGMIERKARRLGEEWYKQFVKLSKPREAEYGTMGAIWDAHHIPTAWASRQGGMIGLNLAWINHACIPNATITYESIFPTDKNGNPLFHKPPTLGRAIVRACTEIRPGVEICMPYSHTHGSVRMRRRQTEYHHGFVCVCRACVEPNDVFEDALIMHHRLPDLINDRFVVADKPAIAFRVALDLLTQLLRASVHDNRLVLIWMKCAMIAGHHSDLARAHCFLTRARQLAFLLEGPSGGQHRQLRNWHRAPRLMPGFGGTLRGLSSVPEAMTIYRGGCQSKQILFMLGAAPTEYIRVCRYKQWPAPGAEHPPNRAGTEAEEKYAEMKDTLKPQWEIVDGLDPIPPKLDITTEAPIHEWCSIESCRICRRTERREVKIRERRRAGETNESGSESGNGEGKNRDESEACEGPEKDLAKQFLDVVDEFEHPSTDDKSGSSDGKKKCCSRSRRGSQWYLEALRNPRILAPNPDANTSTSASASATMHDAHSTETAESVDDACDEPTEHKSSKKRRNKKKGKKKKKKKAAASAEPMIQDVGAEKKVVLVESDECVGCSSADAEHV